MCGMRFSAPTVPLIHLMPLYWEPAVEDGKWSNPRGGFE